MGESSSMLVEHWRKLDGPVHPEDRAVFDANSHTFNLEFPPPAFIGDVENAPFLLLMMNGGFDASITPLEFPNEVAITKFIDRLHNPRAVQPNEISPYYESGNYGNFIANGRLALVNAVAYRSGKLSDEPWNKRVAEKLPSVALHRRWLMEQVIPEALNGRRTMIAHRQGMWKINKDQFNSPNVVFTNSPASPYLPNRIIDILRR